MKTAMMGALFVLLAIPLWAIAEVKKDVEYGRIDGVPLLLDAYLLDGPGPYPTLIYVHGGGFTAGDKRDVPKPLFDEFAKAGFNWISVNYRLAPTFTFPAETNDVELAVEYVKSHASEYKLDSRKLVLMGGSAGGHLVSFVGAKHRPGNQVAAVVSMYGEHDLVTRTKPTTDCAVDGRILHTDQPEPCVSSGLKAFLGISGLTPETSKIIREASPITYVQKDIPPYLLVHGSKDLYVPYEQSVLMCRAMKAAGAHCEILTVEGGGHGGWDTDPIMQDYRLQLMRWIREVL